MKKEIQTERRHLQVISLMKDLYPEYIKNYQTIIIITNKK